MDISEDLKKYLIKKNVKDSRADTKALTKKNKLNQISKDKQRLINLKKQEYKIIAKTRTIGIKDPVERKKLNKEIVRKMLTTDPELLKSMTKDEIEAYYFLSKNNIASESTTDSLVSKVREEVDNRSLNKSNLINIAYAAASEYVHAGDLAKYKKIKSALTKAFKDDDSSVDAAYINQYAPTPSRLDIPSVARKYKEKISETEAKSIVNNSGILTGVIVQPAAAPIQAVAAPVPVPTVPIPQNSALIPGTTVDGLPVFGPKFLTKGQQNIQRINPSVLKLALAKKKADESKAVETQNLARVTQVQAIQQNKPGIAAKMGEIKDGTNETNAVAMEAQIKQIADEEREKAAAGEKDEEKKEEYITPVEDEIIGKGVQSQRYTAAPVVSGHKLVFAARDNSQQDLIRLMNSRFF